MRDRRRRRRRTCESIAQLEKGLFFELIKAIFLRNKGERGIYFLFTDTVICEII